MLYIRETEYGSDNYAVTLKGDVELCIYNGMISIADDHTKMVHYLEGRLLAETKV